MKAFRPEFSIALGIREIVDRIVPMERDVGGLTYGKVLEQLVLNRLDDPCPLPLSVCASGRP